MTTAHICIMLAIIVYLGAMLFVGYLCSKKNNGINMKEMAPDPEKLHEMKLNEETYPLTEELFENDALIFDNTQIEEAWICHKDGTPYVGVKSEGFPSYGIWSVKDAPFVCLEPWMGRCDNIGFDKEISEKPGINKVESGETFEKEYQIVVAI